MGLLAGCAHSISIVSTLSSKPRWEGVDDGLDEEEEPEPVPRRGRAATVKGPAAKGKAESTTSRRREVTKYTGPISAIHVTQTACSKSFLLYLVQLYSESSNLVSSN